MEILPESPPDKIDVLIGPEGGFSENEINYANEKGFIPASLGSFRMRSEAASFCALSSIRVFYGNKNN